MKVNLFPYALDLDLLLLLMFPNVLLLFVFYIYIMVGYYTKKKIMGLPSDNYFFSFWVKNTLDITPKTIKTTYISFFEVSKLMLNLIFHIHK